MNTIQRIDTLTENDELFLGMVEAVFGDPIIRLTNNTVIRNGYAYGESHSDDFVNVMAVAS
jgi:hypothetical protein